MQFVNTNLPKERSKILRTKDQLSSLPNDCADISNKTALISTLQDHQPRFLVENVVCHLISLALKMCCRKVCQVLGYHITHNKYAFL